MYLTCKANLPIISGIDFSDGKNSAGLETKNAKNPKIIYDSIKELEAIECLNDYVVEMLNACSNDKMIMKTEQFFKFQENREALVERTLTIIDLGNSIGINEIESGFDIKLPSNLSFSDLSKGRWREN